MQSSEKLKRQPAMNQVALAIVAMTLAALLAGCGSSASYYKLAKHLRGRYSDRQTPRTIYVGEEKQTAWVMIVESHHPVTDFVYGPIGSAVLVFEPPLWSTRSVTRLKKTSPPWQCLWSVGRPRNNLREIADLAFPRKYDTDSPTLIPVWVVSIEPLVFAAGENRPGCPFEVEHRSLNSYVYAPRAEDFDCNIISIAAFAGVYPGENDSEAKFAAKKEFRRRTFETPIKLGDLLDHPELWQQLGE